MMTDKELIKKIQLLRQIKPREDWVVFVKNQILEKDEARKKPAVSAGVSGLKDMWFGLKFIFSHKYAFSLIALLVVTMGVFGFSLRSNSDDALSLRKIVENGQMAFMTGEEKVSFNLNKANQQMDDLTKAVKENDTQKINPALNEYKASISAATQNLVNEKDKNKIKEVVEKVKQLENKEGLVQSLGIELGENLEKDLALVKLISDQVKEIEARNDLSMESRQALYQIKDFCEKGYFTEALDLILVLNK